MNDYARGFNDGYVAALRLLDLEQQLDKIKNDPIRNKDKCPSCGKSSTNLVCMSTACPYKIWMEITCAT